MVFPPELRDTVTPVNRSVNASGYFSSGFGSANGMGSPFTQNNCVLQPAVKFAHHQSPFGGSAIGMSGPSTQNIGASNSAVQPVVHPHSPFGRTSLQPMKTSFTFGESPSASGFGASNPSYGFAVNPIAPPSSAPAFGSTTANPIPFGASTSAHGFGASNPTFSSAVNPIAPTSSVPAFGSTTANPAPFGASTSANGFGASNPTFGSAVNPIAPTYSAPAFGSTTANPIHSVAPTSSAHVFGSTITNPTPFGASTFGVTTANSIPFVAPTSGSTAASPSAFGGSSQSFFYNQQFGSCLRPYTRTIDSDTQTIISISAMDIYKNKSHEELRLEDYMQRIKVSSLFSLAPVAANSSLIRPVVTNRSKPIEQDQSNLQQSAILFPGHDSQSNSFSNFSHFQVPFHPSSNTGPSFSNPTSPFEHASQSTGTSSSIPVTGTNSFVNYNTQPQPSAFHNFPVAIVTFMPPEVASYIASCMPLLGTQISPTTTPFGRPTTNVTSPSINLFGGSLAMTGSVGAHSTNSIGLNAPIKTPSTAPTASTPSNFGGCVWCGSGGGQSTVSASVSSPIMGTSASQSMFHFPAPSPSFGTPEAFKNTASCKMQSNEIDTSIPKGLEIIAEKLGFNPWPQEKAIANKLDFEVGPVLPCVDADKDEDIIALAEFAVEQHNTLHKDDVTFLKVVVACLEAVGGGRYHIVLETLMPWKRFYAVVLRKGTQRSNQVTVLEKWISSKP